MKKVIFIFFLIAASFTGSAQNVKQDKDGNYVQTTLVSSKADTYKETGKTFTDNKGNVYPVLISKTGLLFYKRTAKSGNVYNCYLKVAQ